MNILVSEEIDRMIAEAVRKGKILSAPNCAADIVRTYSRCRLDVDEVADGVMMAAARAGVPVEFGRVRQVAATTH
jgi:hypothetical protein